MPKAGTSPPHDLDTHHVPVDRQKNNNLCKLEIFLDVCRCDYIENKSVDTAISVHDVCGKSYN